MRTASIDEFPGDFFTPEQRLHGAIICHLIIGFYCFVLIAFICNDYFLPSVFCICQGKFVFPLFSYIVIKAIKHFFFLMADLTRKKSQLLNKFLKFFSNTLVVWEKNWVRITRRKIEIYLISPK